VRDLLILGTGVHAFEMAEIVERINRATPTWRLLGHLTPDAGEVGQIPNGYQVLGTADQLGEWPDALLVPDNEWPSRSGLPVERLATIIDPSVFVSRTATIGAGCVLYPGCYVGLNARIGDLVFSLGGSTINHDDAIGRCTVLASGVTIAGSVTVGERCYLGQSCTIRQLLTVGAGSLIGMGSVVIRDVPPNSVMVGNPARRIRDNRPPGPGT
jgi:carbonic anhydrase/acetyltransferase-like protein (isoleucine patch superfamily)